MLGTDHGNWQKYLDTNVCSIVEELRPETLILWERVFGKPVCGEDACGTGWEDPMYKVVATLVYVRIAKLYPYTMGLMCEFRGAEDTNEFWVIAEEILQDVDIYVPGDKLDDLVEVCTQLYNEVVEKVLGRADFKIINIEMGKINTTTYKKIVTNIFDRLAMIRDRSLISKLENARGDKAVVMVGKSHIPNLEKELSEKYNLTISEAEDNENEGDTYKTLRDFLA
ncbi:MAG: hypothetical protein ACREFO_16200 [Acetobacteraceae bacterium]